MGVLVNGEWKPRPYTSDEKGRFKREATKFHDWVTRDGSSGFPAEAGRYHLYVSYACPWAHRVLILRKLRGLEDAISLSVVDWLMGEDGWFFSERDGAIPDSVNGKGYLRDVYRAAQADYTGRVTVPVLWDKERGTIVNNESRELIRMLDDAFRDVGDPSVNLHPQELHADIERTIDAIYDPINNGVYRSGFASTQEAYEEAVTELFEALDHWEHVLSKQRYLCGDRMTEADVCLFTTLFRFDPVYHYHFKCNLRRLRDYPNLWGFTRDVYQTPGVAETCNLHHIKNHYFQSHESVNPTRIVPKGPKIDYTEPHDRERF